MIGAEGASLALEREDEGLMWRTDRLSYGLAVRTAKKGLIIGLGFGLAQDAVRCMKG
jgi:hypothetical protein